MRVKIRKWRKLDFVKNDINIIITKEAKLYTAKTTDLPLFKVQGENYSEVTNVVKSSSKKHIDLLKDSGVLYPIKYDHIERITFNASTQTFLYGHSKLFKVVGLSNISDIDRTQFKNYETGKTKPEKNKLKK